MEEDAGMVQSIGGLSPAARSNHFQADHSRERVTLTRHTPPSLGENITIYVKPSHMEDSVPTEEVKWAVRKLRGYRLGFPYYMSAEHLWE